LTLVNSNPLARPADAVKAGIIRACSIPAEARNETSILPFDISTSENI